MAIALNLVNCQQKEEAVTLGEPTNQIVIGQIDSVYTNALEEA
jgi:hypothetical protein